MVSSNPAKYETHPETGAGHVSPGALAAAAYLSAEAETVTGIDPESRSRYSSELSDPYGLGDHIKSESDIGLLSRFPPNTARKRIHTLTSPMTARREREIQAFYRSQNERIRALLKSVDDHQRDARSAHGATALRYQLAVKGSLVANCVLAALQLYAAVSSSSLSLFTTMADSVFDPLSGLVLMMSHRAVSRVDPLRYPSGRSRISTVGNITFSFLMFSVSLVLIVMSVRELAEGSESETNAFHVPSVIAVAVAFSTKLVLFFYCWTLKGLYSQVEILWRDHRNDIPVNAFGILTYAGGSNLRWWIDPMGAIILSVVIAGLWLRTAYDEFQLLVGVTAEPEFLQLITYIAATHSPHIQQIDTVRAYHSGPRFIVEVDVVMDRNERLEIAHDVAEALQINVEKLPGVERAYVHIDYETSHKPEHDLKKEL
ncbi:hypothetical protein ACRALDRAFT_1048532 [Sodiomyces alcalophilus JCM 7366]|uniref:uncharacterized protein n=1 Tax=Sodiomyces alcalophilus JCM 7366 TaxID=591952 RepID=UPI0039B60B6E